ncbi:chorismate-binding protein [Carboxylicivirga sp. M1479]|uniref:chorismate-binding protein n=1 Tax=Carboxylicivirga sp. M1479 TaxID=2594476 RepID=UPI001177927F|nr:chorismate-binding protein [Carboxylicivirga sp. M1479]TRX70680.1 hypothetical protein FNN09_10425 [Carboxylicivirga sp. M1479]
MKKEFEQIISQDNFDAVVLYRLPNETGKQVILGNSEKVYNGINEHHLMSDGFVFEPFDNTKMHGVFVNNNFSAGFQSFSTKQIELLTKILHPTTENDIIESDYKTYLSGFNKIKQAINDKDINKAILSRIKLGPHLTQTQSIKLFEALSDQYPHAFVYFINTPHCGTWIGAGPELLLQHQNKHLSTVSLAGTLPNNMSAQWSNKEKHEQILVTNYIEHTLLAHQAENIEFTDAQTTDAGPIKHLCTTFNFKLEKINGNHVGLLYDLHPTPAVCGMPKNEAHEIILDAEPHDRNYYSGFLGPVKNGSYQFYVNIRCLNATSKHTALFVGGGITLGSEAENEWNETELKAKTLLSVLKNI